MKFCWDMYCRTVLYMNESFFFYFRAFGAMDVSKLTRGLPEKSKSVCLGCKNLCSPERIIRPADRRRPRRSQSHTHAMLLIVSIVVS